MADSDAHTGMGALLQRGDGESPEVFTTVLGIKSINGPSIKRDTHDTTDMASTGGFREFIGGLVDGGEVGFEANFLPRDVTQNQEPNGMMAEFDYTSCNSRRNWRITLPVCAGDSDGYWEFGAILTGMDIQMPMDDLMSFSGTLKISGRPDLVIVT